MYSEILRKWPGLTLATAKRVEGLESLVAHIEKRRDPGRILLNLMTIKEAYKAKEMEYEPGLVTYWSRGVQVGGPAQFSLEDFLKHCRENGGGGKAFWVEGVCIS